MLGMLGLGDRSVSVAERPVNKQVKPVGRPERPLGMSLRYSVGETGQNQATGGCVWWVASAQTTVALRGGSARKEGWAVSQEQRASKHRCSSSNQPYRRRIMIKPLFFLQLEARPHSSQIVRAIQD